MRTSKLVSRYSLILTLVLLAVLGGVRAQNDQPKEDVWTSVFNDEISIQFPTGSWVTSAEPQKLQIYRSTIDFNVSVVFSTYSNAKDDLLFDLLGRGNSDPRSMFRNFGDFQFYQRYGSNHDVNGNKNTTIYIASPKGVYEIYVSSQPLTAEKYGRVLSSILLKGKPLFGEMRPAKTTEQSVEMSRISTNDVALVALRQPDSTQEKLIKPGKGDAPEDLGDIWARKFSRRFIIVKKDKAAYTTEARDKNVSGDVILSVTFKGDGTLGDITLVKSLHDGLDDMAFQAAKKIKFVPALIDGKGVDVVRRVQYGFSIY